MKTPEQYADMFLIHRTTYTTEEDLKEKRRKRLTELFDSAMKQARVEAAEKTAKTLVAKQKRR